MRKICIVFDRLRSEEKMLRKEAEGLGCDVTMTDAKSLHLGTESRREDLKLGDVVLERCISYFRGLHVTSALEFLGVPVINKFAVASVCGNKMFMTLLLKKHGVPTPETRFAFSRDSALENATYPLVIKPVIGSWGRGVIPVRDRDTLDAISEMREISDAAHDRIYYMQELIRRPPRDIRVITVGGRPVSAMYRNSDGGFKTNLALGADPEVCKLTPEMRELASKASDAVGGGILGVDMMEDEGRGLLVHEVNNTVEFKGLTRVSDSNIPREMVKFALESAR